MVEQTEKGASLAVDDIVEASIAEVTRTDRLISKEQAIERAATSIGLTHYKAEDVIAEGIQLSHESLPYLASSLAGHNTWRIEFANLELGDATRNPRVSNHFIDRLIVLLAPTTWNVMKVTSVWPANEPRIAEYPACSEETRQLAACNIRYVGLPLEMPAVSLAGALVASDFARNVRQICACYVAERRLSQGQMRVWVVQMRGPTQYVEFSSAIGDIAVPDDAANHIRNVVDASTGRWLYANTIPQPCSPLEYRH